MQQKTRCSNRLFDFATEDTVFQQTIGQTLQQKTRCSNRLFDFATEDTVLQRTIGQTLQQKTRCSNRRLDRLCNRRHGVPTDDFTDFATEDTVFQQTILQTLQQKTRFSYITSVPRSISLKSSIQVINNLIKISFKKNDHGKKFIVASSLWVSSQ